MIKKLHENRLIFVTGKGGVGKSTVTAALGQALANQGRRTLILETDTYSAMEDLFNFRSSGLKPVKLGPNLWASNLLAEDCFIATLRRFVPSERVARAIINNRVARVFFKAAPSVNEVTILDQVRVFFEETEGGRPRFDHVIVDLPASGHAVTFLNVPATMSGMMRGLGPIAKMAMQVSDIIKDERTTAVVAVCLPEEMPVNETIELSENLRTIIGRPLTLAMVNMVHRPPLDASQRQVFERLRHELSPSDEREANTLFDGSSTHANPIVRLIEGNAMALGWHDRDQKYLRILHERMREPVVEIPVFFEANGTEIVDHIASFLIHGDNDAEQNLAS
ncbi:MAG: ArsA family ATPase [Bradymonadaceae bacterium]|nr:ArsA family ATPase [Lujinxingiaceae bacterium]